MNLYQIIGTVVLAILSIILAFFLVKGIRDDIVSTARIKQGENTIIEQLKLIRETELVFQEVNGRFTSDWDRLMAFVDTGTYYITQRREEIITLSYGADSIVVHIDTLGSVPVKERILREYSYVTAADSGVFNGFLVKMGDQVVNRMDVYRMTPTGKNGTVIKAINVGEVVDIEPVQPGDEIVKGQNLIQLLNYKFDPNTDFSRLPFVPVYGNENVKFEIFADKIDKSGVTVDVIEVVNPRPLDPTRDEDSDFANRRHLRFGSKTQVSTAGNWE